MEYHRLEGLMKKYFAVSDVHSFYSSWMHSLKEKGFERLNPDHYVIICGDLFDRGNNSLKCLNFVTDLAKENRLIYVRGNHEDLLSTCVSELKRSYDVSRHHITNGTIKTIAHLVGVTDYDIICRCFDWKVFDKKMNDVLSFIDDNSVDYFELGDTIFVHGWVPTTTDEEGNEIIHANFRDGGWKEARWANGMAQWRKKLIPEGKTVVCGHWHTSYGWSNIDRICSEWDADAVFDTYIKPGIVALDACTAHTGKINCVVFNEKGKMI